MASFAKRGFGLNGKSSYENIAQPQFVNLTFTVNAADTGGLGVTSVKSNGYVRNVFMHTSATPGSNNGYTNPNPASGFVWVQFYNNFNHYLNGLTQFRTPTTGSIKIDNAALTAGQVYVITTLGDATTAKWQAIGVPAGVTPAVGVSFVALNTGTGSNTLTSRVSTPTTSGVYLVESVGITDTMFNSDISANGGAWLMLQFSGPTAAGNTALIPTAPAVGTVVSMRFIWDGSSVTIDGL